MTTGTQISAPRRRAGREGGLPEEVVRTLLLRQGPVALMGLEGAGALTLGLRLVAVSARDRAAAAERMTGMAKPPPVVTLQELAKKYGL